MENYKVSIIVPVYNSEQYIKNCINSILNQTYKNIEIIIINDGSSDNSFAICKKLSNIDKRIKLINQVNSGPSVARNNGIENSTGDLIQFIDSDDTVRPNMVSRLIEELDDETDLVICGYDVIDQTTGKVTYRNNCGNINKKLCFEDFKKQFAELFDLMILRQPWNKLYRKKIIIANNIRFNSKLRNAEDLLFNLEYFEKCNNYRIVEYSLYKYFIGIDNSLTSDYKPDYFENRKNIYFEIQDFLKRNNINESNKFHRDFLREVNNCFINLFHKNSPLNKNEITSEISRITTDIFVMYVFKTVKFRSIKELILKYLITRKKINLIYYYYYYTNIGIKW